MGSNSNNDSASSIFRFFSLAILGALAAIAVTMQGDLKSMTGPVSKSKPYATVGEFWPYYASEHSDPMCQLMHFTGTSIVILIWLFEPRAMMSAMIACIAAYIMFPALRGLDNGLVEGAILGIFAWFFGHYNKVLKYVLLTMLIGYGFAWIGHFEFEKNKPATFIYPSYSLICDFRLWISLVRQLYFTNYDFNLILDKGLDERYWI